MAGTFIGPGTMKIINGRIISGNAVIRGASVIIDDGRIGHIGKASKGGSLSVIDAKGFFVSPGFIDSHIHGDPANILPYEVRYGTTAIVPAISCSSPADLSREADSIRRFKERASLGGCILGLRVEGPYISRERAGAQDKRSIKRPSVTELRDIIKRCGPLLKIMTLAPELNGADELIRVLREKGIIASMGHTASGYEEGLRSIDSGITHATHLFNGMRRMDARGASAALACLSDDRIIVEIIFDLIHVRPELLNLALAMKKKRDIILITDSVRAVSGSRRTEGGVYRLKNGTIAGSDLTMIGALRNAVKACGVGLADAVRFAATNPAALLGAGGRKGSITKGKDADIVIFDEDFDVKMTMVRGKIVYRKRGF
ncbi:MAG: N-acetylglucosamine-6-phosphate deacetylase [Candidatus Omnitrophota bacterium]